MLLRTHERAQAPQRHAETEVGVVIVGSVVDQPAEFIARLGIPMRGEVRPRESFAHGTGSGLIGDHPFEDGRSLGGIALGEQVRCTAEALVGVTPRGSLHLGHACIVPRASERDGLTRSATS